MAVAAQLAPPPRTQYPAPAPARQAAGAPAPSNETLMAENTAAAAASAVGSLVRALAAEQRPPVLASAPAPAPSLRAGGPPVDQVLRDLLRPLVKDWLDHQLPDLVERLVRAEVRRIVGGAA